jgi:hypothetical protein
MLCEHRVNINEKEMNPVQCPPRSVPRFRISVSLAILLTMPCVSLPGRAETVIGPGMIAAPLEILGEFRIVAGTEIVSNTARVFPDGESIRGDEAVLFNIGSAIFDGGDVQGATVTTQPGIKNASGGAAISNLSGGNPILIINDGRFRGGSVLVTEPAPSTPNFHAAAAIAFGGADNESVIMIHGGLFEGGVISMATAPDVVLSRAPALALSTNYGIATDIFGGEFVGGIKIWGSGYVVGPTRLAFHGSDLAIEPPPVNERVTNTEVTISGRYADGSPFSHHVNVVGGLFVHQGADFLALDNIPEPSAGALSLLGGTLFLLGRRRPKSQWTGR